MDAFVRVLAGGRARPADRTQRRRRTPSCTGTCSRPSTGSPPLDDRRPARRSSARRCATTSRAYALSPRSSARPTRTWNGSTSTGGSCCCGCRGGPRRRSTSGTPTCRTSGLSSPARTTCRCLRPARTACCAGSRPTAAACREPEVKHAGGGDQGAERAVRARPRHRRRDPGVQQVVGLVEDTRCSRSG